MNRRLFVSGTAFTGMSAVSFSGLTAALAARATKPLPGPGIYCAPSICPPVHYKYVVPVSTSLGNVTAQYNTWTQVAHSGTDTRGDQYDALVNVSADSKNIYMQHNITAPAIRAAPITLTTASPIHPPTTTFTQNGITITYLANGGAAASFSSGGYVWTLTAIPLNSSDSEYAVTLSNNAGFSLTNLVNLPASISGAGVRGIRPADACWALHRSVTFLLSAGSVILFVAGLEGLSIIATGPAAVTALLGAGIMCVGEIANMIGGFGECN